jgi:hypothetical protein
MADVVTNNTIFDSPHQRIIHLTNISDGTGEAAVVKIDKSSLTASDGAEPDALDIEWIDWNIQGITSVRLLWDHTTDDVAMVLNGNGYKNFRDPGGLQNYSQTGGLKDPRSAGATGDLLLTTNGAASGGTYDITICVKKAAV